MQTIYLRRLALTGGLNLVLATAVFGQCPLSNPPIRGALNYLFEPLLTNDGMKIRVTLDFNGGPKGKVKLELPSEWAGQQHLENSITELKPLSPETTMTETKSPSERDLRFPPNAVVRISYVLVKDWKGRLDSGTRFRSDLSPNYFHLIGTSSLVHPVMDEFAAVDVNFDWQKLPPIWSLATSFGTGDRCQSFHGLWHDALNSLFVGGDYRIYRTTISGNAFDFAIRGKWSFTDDEWVRQVSRVAEFERAFWQDNNFPYFLVTLTPLDQDRGSTGGTELTNSFMMHISRLDPLSTRTLGTLAHETFHTWNPGKIGHPPGSDYPVSWFFEGFTAYYQDVMLLRAGLMTFPDYVSAMNDKLRNYEMTEGTNVGLDEFVRRHSAENSVLNQLDNRRGSVLAGWLDASIRRERPDKASLDNVMFDLASEDTRYKGRHNGKPETLSNQRIFREVAKYIGKESMESFRRYVEQGGSIPLPANALGPCVQSSTEMLARFDVGFDQRSVKNENKLVFGVEPDSEAYKAGLRDGQQLLGWSIYNGDTTKQVKLSIKSDNGSRTITYFPLGTKVAIQQFTLNSAKYSFDPAACESAVRSVAPSN